MQFPVYLRFGPLSVHPHWVFEGFAYLVGFRLFLRQRRRRGDRLARQERGWIVAAAIAGAAAGSKILYWLVDPAETLR
ncbi:MAG TPA: diacylglyceryl transferase, partial [Candidatus Polarisedimenticolia bacterium]|nr:diacylglyceryl transferase [Candidatus Polarisedimenticolia bacterium]